MTDAAAPLADSSKPADPPKAAATQKPLPPYTRKLRRAVDPIGTLLSETFHLVGLFAIGACTVWAAGQAFVTMVSHGSARLDDLLLLFIYLEIGSMVGIYFRTKHMPVRFLIYVGITALTRHMIVYVQHEGAPDLGILYMAGGTLILAIAVLIIRYASHHYPSRSGVEATEDG
jgi:phosphate starvation-inducible membrane PsiE